MEVLNPIVAVYRNLHMPDGGFSVMDWKTGKVIDHTRQLSLGPTFFLVRERGRQRVLREKRKNVHAFVIGRRLEPVDLTGLASGVWYDPYKTESFLTSGLQFKVSIADLVTLRFDGSKPQMLAINPRWKQLTTRKAISTLEKHGDWT
jgi:hypothetical protein